MVCRRLLLSRFVLSIGAALGSAISRIPAQLGLRRCTTGAAKSVFLGTPWVTLWRQELVVLTKSRARLAGVALTIMKSCWVREISWENRRKIVILLAYGESRLLVSMVWLVLLRSEFPAPTMRSWQLVIVWFGLTWEMARPVLLILLFRLGLKLLVGLAAARRIWRFRLERCVVTAAVMAAPFILFPFTYTTSLRLVVVNLLTSVLTGGGSLSRWFLRVLRVTGGLLLRRDCRVGRFITPLGRRGTRLRGMLVRWLGRLVTVVSL